MALLIPEGDNLVTYYLLPLVGVNKTTFGKHYKCSYVNKEGTKVYVELKRRMVAPLYKQTTQYSTEIILGEKTFVVFNVPYRHLKDAFQFIAGQYSCMSSAAKKVIYATSTLPYNKRSGSFLVSNPILQALDKTKTLRTHLIHVLGIKTLPNSAELIDLPDKSWFIENRIV